VSSSRDKEKALLAFLFFWLLKSLRKTLKIMDKSSYKKP
jgi:hypothetical protein